jgi:hypothetical protein
LSIDNNLMLAYEVQHTVIRRDLLLGNDKVTNNEVGQMEQVVSCGLLASGQLREPKSLRISIVKIHY